MNNTTIYMKWVIIYLEKTYMIYSETKPTISQSNNTNFHTNINTVSFVNKILCFITEE